MSQRGGRLSVSLAFTVADPPRKVATSGEVFLKLSPSFLQRVFIGLRSGESGRYIFATKAFQVQACYPAFLEYG